MVFEKSCVTKAEFKISQLYFLQFISFTHIICHHVCTLMSFQTCFDVFCETQKVFILLFSRQRKGCKRAPYDWCDIFEAIRQVSCEQQIQYSSPNWFKIFPFITLLHIQICRVRRVRPVRRSQSMMFDVSDVKCVSVCPEYTQWH